MPAADPSYDLNALPLAGQVLTRERLDALAVAYQANGFAPLSEAQIAAAAGAALTFPTTLPRLDRRRGR